VNDKDQRSVKRRGVFSETSLALFTSFVLVLLFTWTNLAEERNFVSEYDMG